MTEILVGANPFVRLYDGERVTALASIWRVDRSAHGAGTAIVLWHDDRVRVLGASRALAEWVESAFTRHFPESREMPSWPAPSWEPAAVALELDLSAGLDARAADVTVRMSGVLDRRPVTIPAYDLGGVPHHLRLDYAPVREAAITVAGVAVPGVPRVDEGPPPNSTAFLTDDEVWTARP